MRLDYKKVEVVRTVVDKIVGKGSRVRVFGSRLNDSKRGGDLDLLVESDDPVDASDIRIVSDGGASNFHVY
jgi:hypothetical protein